MIDHPVSFKHSQYRYRVTCGAVKDPNSISWAGPTYLCDDWASVNHLHEMWSQVEDHPALRIRMEYTDGEEVTPP